MSKKKISIIIFIIALTFIAIGVFITIGYKNKKIKNNNQEETKNSTTEKIIHEETKMTQIALEEISTIDKSIIIQKTTGYYLYETFGATLTILSNKNYNNLYLILKFDLGDNQKEIPIVMHIESLEANKSIVTEIQHTTDLTKSRSWSVEITTKEGAIKAGLIETE